MRPTLQVAHFVLGIFLCLLCSNSFAQCGTTISTFPYVENFETSAGSWTAGGTSSSWAWGTPTKTTINTAGSGTKCWVIGGLSGIGYNSCERSYVESPCFDFTALTKPVVAFKIFWECENKFDGVTFQYTINNGSTWQNVGAFGDPIDCHTENWFNYDNITHLGSSGSCSGVLTTTKHGWCGSIFPTSGTCQGGGSNGQWITAKHCVANLAGQSSVRFRFAFGAGNSCNAYDGVAFDSVAIYNARAISVGIKATCIGNKQYDFKDTIGTCITNYIWNFGDPSNPINSSGASNPTHTFSSNGTYTVTATAQGGCANNAVATYIINTMNLSNSTTNVLCAGQSNGTASTTIFNAPSSGANYTLMPGNIASTSGSFTGLQIGTYTVTATTAAGCVATNSFSLFAPAPLTISVSPLSTSAICANGNGKIIVQASGGTGAYAYVLNSTDTNTTGQFTNLNATNYTIAVLDANGCATSTVYTIIGGNGLRVKTLAVTDLSCPGKHDGAVNVTSDGGVPPIIFNLQLANVTNTNGRFTNLAANTYTLTILDNDGCSVSTTVTIKTPEILSLQNKVVNNVNCFGNTSGSISFTPNGGTGLITATILPQNQSQTSGYNWQNLAASTYTIILSDVNNCTIDAVIPLLMLGKETDFLVNTINTNCVLNSSTGSATVAYVNAANPITYTWSVPTLANSKVLNFLEEGNYSVVAIDALGCSDSAQFKIGKDNCCKDLRMATAFTPNEDGKNDKFNILGNLRFALSKFEIYDRWGRVAFSTTDANATWDGYSNGKLCDAGTYFYYVNYTCLEDGQTYTFKGDVELIR
jgi:gliding motility-associated-like protein